MSLNNLNTATGQIMPQLVANPQYPNNSTGNCAPMAGQILVFTSNQHQPGIPSNPVSYFVPHRQYIDPASANSLSIPASMYAPFIRTLPQPQPVIQQNHQPTPAIPPPPQQIQRNHQTALALPAPIRQHQQKVKHASISKRSVEYSVSTFQLKDHTNARVENIEEKCFHYINGQLIIETSKPLNDLKVETLTKKEGKKKQASSSSSIQDHNKHTPKKIRLQKSPQKSIQPQQSTEKHVEVRSNPISATSSTQSIVKAEQSTSSCKNDVQKLRSLMPQWSVSEVVKFIEEHDDIKQYAHKFADDEVDGKALLLMIDRNLNLQMLASMFKHGPAMKIEAVLSKYKQQSE